MKRNNILRKCPRCGKTFSLGWNGAGANRSHETSCDACQGNKRDADGCVIRSWEVEPKYLTELKKA